MHQHNAQSQSSRAGVDKEWKGDLQHRLFLVLQGMEFKGNKEVSGALGMPCTVEPSAISPSAPEQGPPKEQQTSPFSQESPQLLLSACLAS